MRQKRALILDNYNTALDGGFTLNELKVGFPSVAEELETVPGMDGSLDFTEAVAGRPTYGMRRITAKLECSRGRRADRQQIFDNFNARFHGRKVHIRIPDDGQKYFIGRINIKSMTNLIPYGWIEIEANCEPWRYSDVPCIHELPIKELSDNLLCSAEIALCAEYTSADAAVLSPGGGTIFPSASVQGSRGAVALWEIALDPNTDYWISGRITEGQGYWAVSTDPTDTSGKHGAIRTGADGKVFLQLKQYSASSVSLRDVFITRAEEMQVLFVGSAPAAAALEFQGNNAGSISVTTGNTTATRTNRGTLEVFLEPGSCPVICYAPAGSSAPILRWTRGDL